MRIQGLQPHPRAVRSVQNVLAVVVSVSGNHGGLKSRSFAVAVSESTRFTQGEAISNSSLTCLRISDVEHLSLFFGHWNNSFCEALV